MLIKVKMLVDKKFKNHHPTDILLTPASIPRVTQI